MKVYSEELNEIQLQTLSQHLSNIVKNSPQLSQSLPTFYMTLMNIPNNITVSIDAKCNNHFSVYKRIGPDTWLFKWLQNEKILFSKYFTTYMAALWMWNDIGNFYDVPLSP